MRTPMITRTIQTTEVTVLCLDTVKAEPFNTSVILPRTYKDDKHIMKKVSAMIDTDDVKAVKVVNTVVKETLYGMSEDDFIAAAEILPPRGSKTND